MNPYFSFLDHRSPLEIIDATPAALAQSLEAIGADRASVPPSAGKWSAREILAHLADCEIVFAFRIRQGLSQENHVIQPFDQDRWAENYGLYDAPTALAVFTSVRQWNLAVVRSLTGEQLARPLSHPERGAMTLVTVIETMAGHDLNHLAQLSRLA